MKPSLHVLACVAATLWGASLAGCGTLPALNAATSESRAVRSISDPSKTITIPDGMVWYATPMHASGIRFPPGTYTLEAEDDDYLYFRSPAPLEFRTFENGRPTDQHMTPGGLMLGKHMLRMVPAGGYTDGEGSAKTLVWKLGGDFVAMEGRQWRKSW